MESSCSPPFFTQSLCPFYANSMATVDSVYLKSALPSPRTTPSRDQEMATDFGGEEFVNSRRQSAETSRRQSGESRRQSHSSPAMPSKIPSRRSVAGYGRQNSRDSLPAGDEAAKSRSVERSLTDRSMSRSAERSSSADVSRTERSAERTRRQLERLDMLEREQLRSGQDTR